MRNIIIIIIFSLIILSCNSKSDRRNAQIKNQTTDSLTKYFDYDEIDYYSSSKYDDSSIIILYDNKSKSEIDSFKMGVVLGDIPKSILDTAFIDKLKQIGYNKKTIENSKFKEIDEIFKEKAINNSFDAACIYIYKDILIFRKKNKTIGIAKICIDCWAKEIYGTNANTETFGQDGDYEKLKTILQK